MKTTSVLNRLKVIDQFEFWFFQDRSKIDLLFILAVALEIYYQLHKSRYTDYYRFIDGK